MKYFSYIFLGLLIASCNQQATTNQLLSFSLNKDSLRQVIMNVDKSWSDSSLQKGFYKSMLIFAGDNAITLRDKKMPLIGKNAISNFVSSHPDSTFQLQWKPLKAEVSESGDLGCSFGGWTLKTKTDSGADTSVFGDYITVWQKQPDNSWKYIMDGGNETPEEVK